jgi:imidazole glycerol-phosphate synthase subunit HisF
MSKLKKRLIPVLLLKNGYLVRSEKFNIHQIIGNPINEVERFNEWNVDELIYIDISRGEDILTKRSDTMIKGAEDPYQLLESVSKTCFMPLTWGGGIKNVGQMKKCFSHGADKVTLNTEAVKRPEIITEASNLYGRQAIVVSIDTILNTDKKHEVVVNGGSETTGLDPVSWAKQAEQMGAGELFLQSVDRDGSGEGYDLDLISKVCDAVKIPVIACSGAGCFEDYAEAIHAGAAAVAAANLWHFKELADRMGKRAMARENIDIRL